MSDKRIKSIFFFLILVFYGSILLHKIDLPAMDDMPRHVKNGELILQGHWDVLYSNFYSYTMPGQRFINHHWLSGVIFYLLYKISGWGGLVIFKVLVLLFAFTLFFFVAVKRSNFWLAAIFSIPTIFILSGRTGLRPEIFSVLFIAIFLYLFNDFDEHPGSKKIYWLIPIQLLWVNLHIFFIIGPALVGGVLLEKIIQRFVKNRRMEEWNNGRPKDIPSRHYSKNPIFHYFILVLALIVVCFINPNGAAGALYPLHIFNNYGFNVSENQPVISFFRSFPLKENFPAVIFILSVAFLALSYLINFKSIRIFFLLATMATAIAGFMIIRMEATFALFFLPAISECWNDGIVKNWKVAVKNYPPIFSKFLSYFFIAVLCVLIALRISGKFLSSESSGIGLTTHSNDGANFFKENNIRGPIFNDYDIGSYLIYNVYPKEKVFMDNRPEAYSPAFFNDVYVPLFDDESLWQRTLEKYQFNTIFLYQYNQGPGVRDFMYRRVADSSWAFVFADQYAVIFVRNTPENQPVINKFRITTETVAQRVDYLLNSEKYDDVVAAADVFNMAGKTDKGMETLFKVVCKWPDKGKIWMVMAEWELRNLQNQKSPLVAIMYLDKAISVGWNTAETYSFLGSAYLKIGFKKEGEQALRMALKINPDREDAKQMLKEMGAEK